MKLNRRALFKTLAAAMFTAPPASWLLKNKSTIMFVGRDSAYVSSTPVRITQRKLMSRVVVSKDLLDYTIEYGAISALRRT